MNQSSYEIACPCKGVLIIMFSILSAGLYVLSRYVWYGSYDWNDFSLFLMNKTLAFSAVIMLFLMSVIPFKLKANRSIVGIITFYLLVAHIILGLLLIPSEYFKVFFDETGMLKGRYGWALFFGVLAFVTAIILQQGFYMKKSSNYPFSFFFRTGILVFFIATLLHIALIDPDFTYWNNPNKILIPVSGLAFVLLIMSFIIGLIRRIRKYKKTGK